MVHNPKRAAQGGDVSGTTRIDVTAGEALPVATASFDPGYSLEETFEGGDEANRLTMADIVQGFATFGRYVGERRRR